MVAEVPYTMFHFNQIIVGPQEIRSRYELSGGSGTTGEHAVVVEGKWDKVDRNLWLKLAHEHTTKRKRVVGGTFGGINVNFPLGS